MALLLQDALRRLCGKSGWCYAIFWKLKQRHRMILTWEDGYCDHSAACDSDAFVGGPPVDGIALLVSKMSYHVYSLGEGIIGRVAFSKKHQWVFAGGGRIASKKYPAGWSDQFSAGIKSIAVIAVEEGVLQLGSLQTVAEDMKLVLQVRAVFRDLYCIPGAFFSDYVTDGKSLSCSLTPGAYVGVPSLILPQQQQQHQQQQHLPLFFRPAGFYQNLAIQQSAVQLREGLFVQSRFPGQSRFPSLRKIELAFDASSTPIASTLAPTISPSHDKAADESPTTLAPLDDIGDCKDWDLSVLCGSPRSEQSNLPCSSILHSDSSSKRKLKEILTDSKRLRSL